MGLSNIQREITVKLPKINIDRLDSKSSTKINRVFNNKDSNVRVKWNK